MPHVRDRSRHDQQQMHGLIPRADLNGDKWTSREATEGVAHLYSSKFPPMRAFILLFIHAAPRRIPAAAL